ncbi:MAG: YebC/PmpR family DNA-binding transcriptional regulator [Candidatus Methylomirabilis sp.]|nr:YebC/PmpR family DNA-binding transcriptional regulator [Deltaproteobacteria bacterium]
MSGHSKWSTIKHKKAAADSRRGKAFSRMAKEISIAARMGGGDVNFNSRLRTAIDAAKSVNMPNDNIKRAIARGTGEGGGAAIEELTYEGYGPGGVAVFVECVTDNRNRTAADIRHVFTKNNGNLGQDGSVAWMFQKTGLIAVPKDRIEEDALMEAALEAGAEDVKDEGDLWEVHAPPAEFQAVRDALEAKGLRPERAEITMIPKNAVAVAGKEAEQVLRLMNALEDHDDVQNVYANFDISDEVMASLS